jgi:hypothetical protein
MDLTLYLQDIHRQLETAAEAGGDEARAVAERLLAPLEAAIRLALQDVLAAAAEEIRGAVASVGSAAGRDRVRGRPAPVNPRGRPAEGDTHWAAGRPGRLGGGRGADRASTSGCPSTSGRIEEAASAAGLSVNSWLVRASAAGLERADSARRRDRRAPRGAERYTGWAR